MSGGERKGNLNPRLDLNIDVLTSVNLLDMVQDRIAGCMAVL